METKIYKSPLKSLKLLLLATLFVAIGIWGIRDGFMPLFLCWTCIIFFGSGVCLSLFNIVDRRPQIIINEVGIYDRMSTKEFVNWEVIWDAYPINISRQEFICLVIDDDFKPSNSKSKFYKKVVELNELFGAQEVNIAVSQLSVKPSVLLSFVKKIIENKNNDSEKGKLLLNFKNG